MRFDLSRDLVAGAILFGFGLVTAVYSLMHYRTGSLLRMGPGMFPAMVGGLLAVLGLVILVQALLVRNPHFRLPMGGTVYILASVALFALLVKPFGLVPSLFVLSVVSGYASNQLRLWQLLTLSAAIAVVIPLIFVGIMKLNLQLFAWPF